MTPFKNDGDNPYARQSVWPKMPQTPLRIGPLPSARLAAPPPARPLEIDEVEVIAAAAEAEMALPEPAPLPAPEPQAVVAPVRPSRAPARRELRLTPLIAAGAVGAGGMAALILLLGVRPFASATPPPAEPSSTLAVGEMVSQSLAPQAAPPPMTVAAPPAAPRPAVRLAAAARAPAPRSAPLIQVQPAATAPVPLLVPPPRPVASLAGPAEPPLTAPPPAAPYVPPPAPDRNAPIATHVPD